MKRYIALLRGINISGKNKIPMRELKDLCVGLGYCNVLTYLNSGNVVFSAEEEDCVLLGEQIKSMIDKRFGLEVPVLVIPQEAVRENLENAPVWWGTETKELYDNLIFVLPFTTAQGVAEELGAPTDELERVCIYKDVIFWSFDRAKYAKANWWKATASFKDREQITIRTANTVKKIAMM